MTALVHEEHAERASQSLRGGEQLARTPGQTMEQENWRCITTRVGDRDGHVTASDSQREEVGHGAIEAERHRCRSGQPNPNGTHSGGWNHEGPTQRDL